jgi:hypothetical protein
MQEMGRGEGVASKGKDAAFDPTVALPAARKGCPMMGNKKANLDQDEALAVERLQSSIEKCITSVAKNNATREEKYDTRWAMMFKKQEVKNNTARAEKYDALYHLGIFSFSKLHNFVTLQKR